MLTRLLISLGALMSGGGRVDAGAQAPRAGAAAPPRWGADEGIHLLRCVRPTPFPTSASCREFAGLGVVQQGSSSRAAGRTVSYAITS